MDRSTPLSWSQVVHCLEREPPGTRLRLPVARVEHPGDAGLMRSIGVPVGQRADYRLDLDHEYRLAIQDFGDHYEACLERALTGPDLETALRESPGSTVLGATAVGALLGAALGRSQTSALTGALIGGLAALAGAALARVGARPLHPAPRRAQTELDHADRDRRERAAEA